MVKNVRKIGIFLSSPGDLTQERTVVEKACRAIEHDHGDREGYVIEVITWKSHTRPAAGDSAQSTINKQIGLEYDIYLGILGTRFGSATEEWGSGTEEEFRLAFKSYSEHKHPEIMFYFAERAALPDSIDPEDLAKRKAFKSDIEEKGIFHSSFEDATQFQLDLLRHLPPTIREILQGSTEDGTQFVEGSNPQPLIEPLENWSKLIASNPKIAANELLFQASISLEKFTKKLNEFTDKMNRFARNIGKKSKELTHATNAGKEGGQVKALQDIVTLVHHHKDTLIQVIPFLHDSMDRGLTSYQRSIAIAKAEGFLNESGYKKSLDGLASMRKSFDGIIVELEGLPSALGNWPDSLPDLKMAKQALIVLHKDMRLFFERTNRTIISIQDNLEG